MQRTASTAGAAPANEAVTRPARTGAQLGVAEVVVQLVEAFTSLTTAQHVALLAALTMLAGWGQVLVENRTGRGVLRQVPPRPTTRRRRRPAQRKD